MVPLLLLRNRRDGSLAVTVSVAPFRVVCLNGMLVRYSPRYAPAHRFQ